MHDPSLVEEAGTLYLFSTDAGAPPAPPYLRLRASYDNGTTWVTRGAIFPAIPAWARARVPAATNLWAPDATWSPTRGLWHVYYAVSSFGSPDSAIGLATTPSLAAPQWRDEGLVLASSAASGFNAIDPAYLHSAGWLVLGSFWSGVYAVRIDPATGKVSSANATLVHLAQRAPPDALEGAFLVERPDALYLFLSWDFCCRGAASNYSVRVGRAAGGVEGGFVDREGVSLLRGGGSPLVGGGHGWAAGGGQSFLLGTDRMVLHAYDAVSGDPYVQLVVVDWGADGWPALRV